jgi:predicted nucleic acid-binding protein
MTATVFVDTNVFVYARDASEPAKQPRAAAWLAHLWRGRTGRTGLQVVSEYYVNVTRKLRPPLSLDDAWDDVRSMLQWRPQPVDEALVVRAHELCRRHRINWWDAQIIAAAQLQGCALLLTEDFQDGATYGHITVRNPFKLAIEEAGAQYGLAGAPPERHRKRGRPARVRA